MVVAVCATPTGSGDSYTMTRNRFTRLDRRTALKTLGGLAVGAGGLAAGSGPAAAAGVGFVGVGVNTFDNDGGGADLRMVGAPDPAGGGTVTHATSDGTRTTDYATSILPTGGVALGDLTRLSYDFYGGERNQRSAPDEVWALLEDGDGTHHVVFRHARADPTGQRWRTRNVLAEIRGNPSLSPGVEWARLTDRTASGSNVESIGTNLLGTFGPDAVLHRVGVGRGRTSGGTVADTYYRNFRVNGRRRDALPAAGRKSPSDGGQQSASDGSQQSAADGGQQSASNGGDGRQSASDGGQQSSSDRRLPKLAIVSSPGVDEQTDYVFEVTGDLRYLEPNEDSGNAFDEVVDAGDRTRVEGTVAYADDRFAFSGDLVEVDVPPSVKIAVRNR